MNRIIVSLMAAAITSVAMNAESLTISADDCRSMALAHSEEVKIADNNVAGSELDLAVARNSRLPRLSGSAAALYMFPDIDMSGMDLALHGTWDAGLTLAQPIYVGGKITAGINLAKIGHAAAGEQRRAARAEVIAAADKAYWTYIAVLEKRRLVLSLIDYIDGVYDQVKSSVDVEMATRADLLRVEAHRSDFNYQLEKVDNGIELCRLNLCYLLGVDFNTAIVPSDTAICIATTPASVIAQGATIANRPEFQLLNYQVDAEREQVKMVRSDYLPQVALAVGYTWVGNIKVKGFAQDAQGNYVPYSKNYNDNMGNVMLSVSVPLFNWGEGCKKVNKQKLKVENARLELDKNTRLMDIELSNARLNLSSAWSMISTAEAGERQAAEALRVINDRYSVGMSTLTDLLEAQSQWKSASSNLIEARAQYKISETEYLRAAGLLD